MQQDNKIEIDEPFRADGFNRILYKCPHCMTEGETEGSGITLKCKKCGATYELDTLGRLKGINVEPKFTHVPDWFAWVQIPLRRHADSANSGMTFPE